jgi:hypothetical protein
VCVVCVLCDVMCVCLSVVCVGVVCVVSCVSVECFKEEKDTGGKSTWHGKETKTDNITLLLSLSYSEH